MDERAEGERVEYSSEYIVELLRRLSVTGTRHMAMIAKSMTLSLTEVVALHHLYNSGGLTPKQLGELMFLTPGAVTQLADRLERAGHLERDPNPTDRRSSVLRQTLASEEEALRRMDPYVLEARRGIAALSGKERELVGQFLENVMRAMTSPPKSQKQGQ